MAVGPAGNTNVPPQNYGGVPPKQEQVGDFKEAVDRSTTSNDSSKQSQGASNSHPIILATRPPINLAHSTGNQGAPSQAGDAPTSNAPAAAEKAPVATTQKTVPGTTFLPYAGQFETFEDFVAAAPAPFSTEFLTEQWQKAHPDTLIVGINPSSMEKNKFVNAGENPGHTLVALKDSSGELVKVFSYGPENHGIIDAAYNCKAEGKTGYALHKSDAFNLYQWPITEDQLEQAEGKMKEIENNPGTYDAEHQCTTTSLEIVESAGIHAPSGKTDVEAYTCGGLLQGIPTPAGLDRDLREQFVPEQVLATYFEPLVEVK